MYCCLGKTKLCRWDLLCSFVFLVGRLADKRRQRYCLAPIFLHCRCSFGYLNFHRKTGRIGNLLYLCFCLRKNPIGSRKNRCDDFPVSDSMQMLSLV